MVVARALRGRAPLRVTRRMCPARRSKIAPCSVKGWRRPTQALGDQALKSARELATSPARRPIFRPSTPTRPSAPRCFNAVLGEAFALGIALPFVRTFSVGTSVAHPPCGGPPPSVRSSHRPIMAVRKYNPQVARGTPNSYAEPDQYTSLVAPPQTAAPAKACSLFLATAPVTYNRVPEPPRGSLGLVKESDFVVRVTDLRVPPWEDEALEYAEEMLWHAIRETKALRGAILLAEPANEEDEATLRSYGFDDATAGDNIDPSSACRLNRSWRSSNVAIQKSRPDSTTRRCASRRSSVRLTFGLSYTLRPHGHSPRAARAARGSRRRGATYRLS